MNLGIAAASVKITYSHSSVQTQIFSSMRKEDDEMFELHFGVQMAQFKMRKDRLRLAAGFRNEIAQLPLDYNPHLYMSLIEKFGTHYVAGGTLGAEMRYYYFVNRTEVESSYSSETDVQDCLTVDTSVRVLWFHHNTHHKSCHTSTTRVSNHHDSRSIATKVLTNHKGGSANMSRIFSADRINEEQLQAYISSIKENPAIISYTLAPICSLVPFAYIDNSNEIRHNCYKALVAYIKHHSPDTCKPCANGGMAVNMNQTCYCACPRGVVGQLCEQKKGSF